MCQIYLGSMTNFPNNTLLKIDGEIGLKQLQTGDIDLLQYTDKNKS